MLNFYLLNYFIHNSLVDSVTFLYPLKTSESHRFSDVFRGYRNIGDIGLKRVNKRGSLSLTISGFFQSNFFQLDSGHIIKNRLCGLLLFTGSIDQLAFHTECCEYEPSFRWCSQDRLQFGNCLLKCVISYVIASTYAIGKN